MTAAGRIPPATAPSPCPPDLVELGRIVNRHGVRGEFRLLPHCAESVAIAAAACLWLVSPAGTAERRRVIATRPHKRFVLMQLEGVATADAAEALIGYTVGLPRAELPALAPGAVYHTDLIGCAVRTTAGAALGTVRELIVTGSNDVCVVGDGAREYLIPLIADVIETLDPAARLIVVRPLSGLLDP